MLSLVAARERGPFFGICGRIVLKLDDLGGELLDARLVGRVLVCLAGSCLLVRLPGEHRLAAGLRASREIQLPAVACEGDQECT